MDPGAPHIDGSRWRYLCTDPHADPETHFRVLETSEGEIVGLGYRFDLPRHDGGRFRAVCVIVHPDHRRNGAGAELFQAIAVEDDRDPMDQGWHLATVVDNRSLAGLPFAKAMGFKKSSQRLVLARELPGRPLPDIDSDASLERFLGANAYKDWAALNNEAFAGVEGVPPVTADELEDGRPESFRPEHVRFARIGNERVGFLFLRETSEGGYIESLGVSPKARGKAVGTALAAWALGYLHERGHSSCEIVVDERNKAALKIFTRLGFEETARRTYLVKKPRTRRRRAR